MNDMKDNRFLHIPVIWVKCWALYMVGKSGMAYAIKKNPLAATALVSSFGVFWVASGLLEEEVIYFSTYHAS